MQCFRMGMGSPLSPILSSLYMEFFETELLPTISPQNFPWFRYVDDVFSVWPTVNTNFDDFLAKLNSLAPTIKFKVEWEYNGSLPFLDILIMKASNGLLNFTVFRKPTHCNLYIHYFSYHHSSTKKATISSMFLRALRICSPQYLDSEISSIWKIFLDLKYPDWFIKECYFKARKTYFVPPATTGVHKPYISLPFIPELEVVKTVNKDLDVNIAYKYTSTIKSTLVRNKNFVDCTAGVYKIDCKDCDLAYIGETGRNLETRVKEHRYAFQTCNLNNAMFKHASENNHSINWDNCQLLYKCNNFKKRRIIESVCIQKFDNFNLNEGNFKLDPVIRSLVLTSLTPLGNSGQREVDRGGG